MAKKKRPSVEEFKKFIKAHPHVRKEVNNGVSWQELFEEWYFLGPDHERWKKENKNSENHEENPEPKESSFNETVPPESKTEANNAEWMSTLLTAVKGLDINQVQQYISNANQAIGALQGVLSAFQGDPASKKEEAEPQPTRVIEKENRRNPFTFAKD
ncbi:spore coat protein YlbD [Bacillus massiliglaciei]|uniref:spore coat protein YlbD n=1 Tax=Bacillus massiliglaciei TaxID=1816693 RepID=UPI000DA620C8|nr:spore coat protein YlbD [Bacillus massiliglaciei]